MFVNISEEEPIELIANSGRKKKYPFNRNCLYTTIILGAMLLFIIVLISLIVINWPKPFGGRSFVGFYSKAAVAADASKCSTIGKNILHKNGSAVDAAIAVLVCSGIQNAQSCGIGGGFFMIVNDKPNTGGSKEMVTFDAREVAPEAASQNMYSNGTSSKIGGKSIAVPGEIKGYYEAWKRFGWLPWSELFQPSIDLCLKGLVVGKQLAYNIAKREQSIRETPSLSEIFVKSDGSIVKEGDLIKRLKYGATLQRIAASAEDFYNGTLAKDVISDIQEFDGIITLKDLNDYKVVTKPAYKVNLTTLGLTLNTLQLPSSGPLLGFMLKVLEGYKLNSSDISGVIQSGITYQKIVESFKFAFALKTYLGDEDFENITEVMSNLTSQTFIDDIRNKIDLQHTHDISYYNPQFENAEEGGTSHINILSEDGGTVAATSTINLIFGSMRRGNRTGIIFNDEMDDFSWPSHTHLNLPASKNIQNYIKPGKRPMSSMVPSIFTDSITGEVKFAIGGSGGTLISTATLYVLAHRLWLGLNISQSVDLLRLHHQLFPNIARYEKGFPKGVMLELADKGHQINSDMPYSLISVVQVIENACGLKTDHGSANGCLLAVCDWRKDAKCDGY